MHGQELTDAKIQERFARATQQMLQISALQAERFSSKHKSVMQRKTSK
jgi:hypothetical protein